MNEEDDLHRAYALKTPEDSRKLYADWATTYDSDFVETRGYVLHEAVASAFVSAGGLAPVLDLGAGTGICGVALARHGIGPVHATDISPEMLVQARAKGVYDTLFSGDILAGLPVPDASYAGIVSSGTFTCGHVGPDGLDEIARLLSSNGLAVVSVRDTHFVSEGFAAKIAALEPTLVLEKHVETRVYKTGQGGRNANDLALLLHLRKR